VSILSRFIHDIKNFKIIEEDLKLDIYANITQENIVYFRMKLKDYEILKIFYDRLNFLFVDYY
jgi:hypothetical protein